MVDNSDRRTEKRVWLKMPLTISRENGKKQSPTTVAETINVSRHGVCLIVDNDLGIGDALTLYLFGSDNQKAISGRVTWQDPVLLIVRVDPPRQHQLTRRVEFVDLPGFLPGFGQCGQ